MKTATEDLTFEHIDLQRTVPVRRYSAEGQPKAWILLSVGFGGDRAGYAFFARHWASLGMTTFVVEHVGSNLDVLRSFPQRTRAERNAEVVRRVRDRDELKARPRDLELVWKQLKGEFEGLPLGLAGHSYGSYTILAASGLEPKGLRHNVDPLPASSLLVISPQPPDMIFSHAEYEKVAVPTLVLTGTRDDLLAGGDTYRERLRVYDHLPAPVRHALVLENLEHMDFAGVGLRLETKLQQLKTVSGLWWNLSLEKESTESWCESVSSELSGEGVEQCR